MTPKFAIPANLAKTGKSRAATFWPTLMLRHVTNVRLREATPQRKAVGQRQLRAESCQSRYDPTLPCSHKNPPTQCP